MLFRSSQTELLYDLGLNDVVVGITKFCIHPAKWFKTKTRVGGTKKTDFAKIKGLNPDLIICNKEENSREEVEELSAHFNVWISDIKNFNDAKEMIRCVGEITGTEFKANQIIQHVDENFSKLVKASMLSEKKVCYLIWYNPLMAVGESTFINSMLQLCGLNNCMSKGSRYMQLSEGELLSARPDIILLSSEPFPFRQQHFDYFRSLLPQTQIYFVDGEMFSWYGSRMLLAVDYFQRLLNQMQDDFSGQH